MAPINYGMQLTQGSQWKQNIATYASNKINLARLMEAKSWFYCQCNKMDKANISKLELMALNEILF